MNILVYIDSDRITLQRQYCRKRDTPRFEWEKKESLIARTIFKAKHPTE